jgi:hypothetical protein
MPNASETINFGEFENTLRADLANSSEAPEHVNTCLFRLHLQIWHTIFCPCTILPTPVRELTNDSLVSRRGKRRFRATSLHRQGSRPPGKLAIPHLER